MFKFSLNIQAVLLAFGLLLLPFSSFATDTDNDGATDFKENLDNTLVSDPSQRPYWWQMIRGDDGGDNFAQSISGIGDVNNDGYKDFIVGSPFDDNNGNNSGSATVFSAFDGSVIYTFNGSSSNDSFGKSVSGAGDVNNDGYDDVIVGAYGYDYDDGFIYSGSAKVYSGIDGANLYTFEGDIGDRFGSIVSGAGDVNGDGYDDLIVGGGMVRVFSGIDGSIIYTFNPDTTVSDAGDVNGDGYDDLIVGMPQDSTNGTDSGLAIIYSGINGSILYSFYGQYSFHQVGSSVSNAGDVDGDGFADVIVGAVGNNSASVYSGVDGSKLYTLKSSSIYTNIDFGWSVSGAGDINNDGFDDLIVGARSDSLTSGSSGSVNIFSGIDGKALYYINGESNGDLLGTSVSSVGDIDNDGYADVIVGALESDFSGLKTGSVRVILTADLMKDLDADSWLNEADNCPLDYNRSQLDSDEDGEGDACDLDDDNDGYTDKDEIANSTNPLWSGSIPPDNDGDFISDLYDSDDDNDGYSDILEGNESTSPIDGSDTPADFDGDFYPDSSDTDDDNDGVHDSFDNCLTADFGLNLDADGDGCDDADEDLDDDNDGYSDLIEVNEFTSPIDPDDTPADNDGDFNPDSTDPDDDNDEVNDDLDAFPFDSTEDTDSDSDGVGDNSDAFPNDPNRTTNNDDDSSGVTSGNTNETSGGGGSLGIELLLLLLSTIIYRKVVSIGGRNTLSYREKVVS